MDARDSQHTFPCSSSASVLQDESADVVESPSEMSDVAVRYLHFASRFD